MTQLTDLRLHYTAVSGDVGDISALMQLTTLHLDSTGVRGWPLSFPSGCSFIGPNNHDC